MSRGILAAILIAGAATTAVPLHAQVYGQFTGAAPVPVNRHLFGAYLTASENVVGGLAQLRLSFHPGVDFGFQGGLARLDPGPSAPSKTTLRLGTDVRLRVSGVATGSPMDMAVGAGLGVETGDKFKVITLGPTIVASRTLGGTGGGVAPYAGVALFFSSRDAFGKEDTDITLPLRLGLEALVSPEFRVVVELQLMVADRYNDDVGFVVGVNLPF